MQPTNDKSVLFRVAGALLALLALTVGLAFVKAGAVNQELALAIAAVKALLVAFFFMELRYSRHLLWILAGGSLFWLFLLMGGSLADLVTRRVIPPPF